MSTRPAQWIDSLGGPLVMLPTFALSEWRGGFGGCEVGVGTPALGTDTGGTDYDWARGVNDLIAVRPAYGDVAVVLNDQPSGTTWRQISSTEGVIARADAVSEPDDVLFQMVAALTEQDRLRLLAQDEVIDAIAAGISPSAGEAAECATAMKNWAAGPSARLEADFRAGDYTILDSVHEGTAFPESLRLRLIPGRYQILSGWHRADAENFFVLHWLRWLR